MKKIRTIKLDVYQNHGGERQLPDDTHLGLVISLASHIIRRTNGTAVRSWYLQGVFGVVQFPELHGDECLKACQETLASHGWTASGEMPPECFEYVRT